jgi:hypothetical protein
MAVLVSLMHWSRFPPQENSLHSFLLEADPKAILRLVVLSQLKNAITSPGIESATFGFAA